VDGSKPEETAASHYRFRVAVDPAKSNELSVEEFHPEETRSQLTDITNNQFQYFSVQNRMTPALDAAFRRVLDQKNQVTHLESEIQSRGEELNGINKDQGRIRENMKALKGSAEEKALLVRYTKQLDSQEDRLSKLNTEIAELHNKQTAEQQKLDEIVQQVTLDESF
jgi:chromosome segregation ATPase